MLLSQYGGGISVERIQTVSKIPLVTVVRLMGVMNKRLNPKSVVPGSDATPEGDAAVIAELERRIAEAKVKKGSA